MLTIHTVTCDATRLGRRRRHVNEYIAESREEAIGRNAQTMRRSHYRDVVLVSVVMPWFVSAQLYMPNHPSWFTTEYVTVEAETREEAARRCYVVWRAEGWFVRTCRAVPSSSLPVDGRVS